MGWLTEDEGSCTVAVVHDDGMAIGIFMDASLGVVPTSRVSAQEVSTACSFICKMSYYPLMSK